MVIMQCHVCHRLFIIKNGKYHKLTEEDLEGTEEIERIIGTCHSHLYGYVPKEDKCRN